MRIHAEPVGIDVDLARSFIVAIAHKEGLLSGVGVGHEHGILATKWSASTCVDVDSPDASRTIVTVFADSLQIDTADARRLAGLSSSKPSAHDREEMQAKMLGPDNLAAQAHPEIRFQTTSVDQRGPHTLFLHGIISIRGITREIAFPIALQQEENSFRFSGAFAVNQTDYGIKPASVSGLVKVRDEVDVRFEIYAKANPGNCK